MTRRTQCGLLWLVIGALSAAYALTGATGWAYRLWPDEPATLTLGLLGCVISLGGIVRTFKSQAWWLTAALTLVFWLVFLGAVVDAALLWFGRTITGFY